MLEDKFEAGNFISTLHIGSCVQYIHGAQKEGIHKSVWNLDKLLKLLFWLFNDSPARREAYLVERDTDKCPIVLLLLTQKAQRKDFISLQFEQEMRNLDYGYQ